MQWNYTKTLMGLGFGMMAFAIAPADANAYSNNYCREYTRTVYIGSQMQEAYGTACLQSDGSWMIVGEGLGNDIPNNVNSVNYVIRDNNRYITPPRVVYYSSPRVVYRNQPAFIWSHNGHYKGNRYVSYKKDKHWDRHDRRDHDRGRGHGYGRRDGHGHR